MPRPHHRPNRRKPGIHPQARPFAYQCPSCVLHPRVVCSVVIFVILLFLTTVAAFLMTFNGFKLPEGVDVPLAERIQREAGMELTGLERSKVLTLHDTVYGAIVTLGKEYGYGFDNPDLDKLYERGTLRPPPHFVFDPKRFVTCGVREDEAIEAAQARLTALFAAIGLGPDIPLVASAVKQLAVERSGGWYAAESVEPLRVQIREHVVKDEDGPIYACTMVIPFNEKAHISTNALMPIVMSAMRHVFGGKATPYVTEWTVNWKWEQMATLYLRFRTKSDLDKRLIYYAAVHPENAVQHAEKFVEIAHKRAAARKHMQQSAGGNEDSDSES
jgi:hypothetical protein